MDLYDSMLQSATAQRLQRARVRAVPAQHSWASLPGPLVSKLLDSQAQTPLVIKLILAPTAASQSGRSPFSNSSSTPAAPSSFRARYIAWAGAVSTTPGCIELPAHLCSALQLPTGCEVLLEVVPGLAAAAAVVVEPVGPADWEVVELNAGLLEEHVLGQAGVVVLGQPLVVWARQAKVTLKVTQIIHDNAAAAAAAAAPGRQLYVRDVARLDQGTELHIAPKPRVTATGSSLAPGALPLGAAAAGSDTAQQHTRASVQQQQTKQQRKPVWLRVCNAGTQHLLETRSLLGHNGTATTTMSSTSSSNGNSSECTADADASSGPATAEETAAAVSSWLTTAVHISRQTSQDLQLQPGEIIRLYSSSSSSSKGQSVLPLQSLVVAVLLQDTVPWGHVALSPPLQQGLGLREHQFVKVRPLHKQKQLQQLPGFLLHPLMPAGVVSSSSSSNGGGLQGLLAAAASPSQQAAARTNSAAHAEGVGHSSAQQQQQQQQRQHRQASEGRKQQQQQQLQQPGVDSFSGPGLVLDTVKGLLTMPLQVIRLQSTLQQAQQQAAANKPQQQQQQQRSRGDAQLPLSAAGPASIVRDSVVGALVDGLVKPKVAAAAMLAWLQVQLAASVAAAVAAAAQQPDPVPEQGQAEAGSKEAGSKGADGAAASSRGMEVCLPVCGPLLVHFKVGQQQQQQPQQQEQQDGPHSANTISSCDHLLLLVPLGEQHQGAAGVVGVSYLPAHLLLPSTGSGQHAQQQQQQLKQLFVQVARPLLFDPSAAQEDTHISTVAQEHSQYISCIYSPSTCPQSLQRLQASNPQPQQQQQQQSVPGWLDPAEYPWLNPALQSGLQRLQPRLDLLTWQSWQSVVLPLPGGVLLVGSSEGGRGWLMQLLGQEAATRHGAHVLKVSCKSLAGQSYETAAAVLASAAAEAIACCPGLLLLDDLDLLMPAPNTEGPAGLEQDQATATRLADWLSGLMQWAAKQPRPLSFCAAVSAAAALPASLRAAGCLDCEVKVPTLGLQGRAALLLSGFRAKGLGFDGGLQGLEALAGKGLEGFDAKDLQLIVDRAVHSALRRGMVAGTAAAATAASSASNAANESENAIAEQRQQQQLLVTSEDVQQALSGFVAAAFWRAGQQQGQQQKNEGGLEGWQDVGGLSDAVSALKEALVLPAKYGHLLAAAPLRLRTGLLLFGPPGCGKTHVVAAAVAATGARLISVKGPELLNKYIGQSEAAVRELFNRAAAAAPCVLFFDEFDAIAPPRGHDSTGVTDRVVNQLLTELDGVEGLTGVAVLAATSRPDLVDAALLRPGRLDRMVYCGFPGEADRLAILQAVGRKLALSADVSLQDIAHSTAGFTGADLAAILSEAQLLAVHDQIDSQPGQQQQDAPEQVEGRPEPSAAACVLTAQHVQRALSRARPSLPATEKQRLQAVYARFQQSRNPGLSNRPAVPEEEQMRVKHATLA